MSKNYTLSGIYILLALILMAVGGSSVAIWGCIICANIWFAMNKNFKINL